MMKADEFIESIQDGFMNKGMNKYVNPSKDPKYSPNLYRYLTYAKHKSLICVYQDKNTNFYYLGIKNDGWFIGVMLMRVFCVSSKAESFCYTPKDSASFIDVTQWFWKKYLEVGKDIYNLPEWHKPNFVLTN